MVLPTLFERFVAKSPLCVMARALLQRALQADTLDELFQRVATVQYNRELLFSCVVELLSRVALRVHPTVRQAYLDDPGCVGVSLSALYQKLNNLETSLGPALVRHNASQLIELIDALASAPPPWREGFAVKLIDGNHLAGTQHRLDCLRGTASAALPGHCLAVLDPRRHLFVDLISCEDAYTQERALLEQVLPGVQANDVWVGDRNLCTPKFLIGISEREAFFAIREHAQLNVRYEGELRQVGRCATGMLYEQEAEVTDEESGRSVRVRRVVVKLDEPTRDGDTEVSVLTNLPTEVADAAAVAELYLTRWSIEVAFGELTVALKCEVQTLGYPKAALFCFAVAVLAANVLAAVRAALAAEQGWQEVEQGLSVYQAALDVAGVYQGMMIALPPEQWLLFEQMSLQEFVTRLRELAARVDWKRLKKSKRGPKKPPPKKPSARTRRHVSTARVLQQRQ